MAEPKSQILKRVGKINTIIMCKNKKSVIQEILDENFKDVSLGDMWKINFGLKINSQNNNTTSEHGKEFNLITYVGHIPESNCYYKLGKKGGISFDFSGCAMAMYTKNDQKYVAHISVLNRSTDENIKEWNKLVTNKEINEIKLFYPAPDIAQDLKIELLEKNKHPVPRNPEYPYNVCGYIDENGNCYSAIVNLEEKKVIYEFTHIPYSECCEISSVKRYTQKECTNYEEIERQRPI